MNYPKTKRTEIIDILHGVKIADPYRWLEETELAEVKDWDRLQNKLSDEYISKIPQNKWLFEKLEKMTSYDKISLPRFLKKGKRIFRSQKKSDQQKWVVFMAEDEKSPFKPLLDPNKWSEEETLDYYTVSDDGKLLAFGKASGGNEAPVIYIMEIDSGRILPDKVKGWKQHVSSWMPDNSGFYYSAHPLKGEVSEGEEYYWSRVYFHKLGTDSSQDELIWSDENKKEIWCWNSITYDAEYEIYGKGIFYAQQYWIKPFAGKNELTLLNKEMDAEYSVSYFNRKLYILTNKNAPNRKVMVTDAAAPQEENWEELIPETDTIEDLTLADGRIYVSYLKNAHSLISVYDLDGNHLQDIQLPCIGSAYLYGYPYRSEVFVWFDSYTSPETIYQYNFDGNSLTEYWKPELEIDSESIIIKQEWFESKDGTKVPMFVFHNKDLVLNGENPAILYGYGGFDVSETPQFSIWRYLLAKLGVVMAIANIRGGGEFGEKWHKAGMKENKQNVFDDFISAGEFLIEKGYTNSDKLAIHGGSNGGLLVGAVMVQKPELFKAVLCEVPLLDMIRYHHSSIANIWAEEYGSAENEEEFKYILRYSPYHNISDEKLYPATLITTGINDARVDPMHARKFAAKLQNLANQSNPILLMVQNSSGHGGGTTQTIINRQTASHIAFLMEQLGIEADDQL
ncbi:MAG: prolyl oligopeptidase family serine peptidase [Candidatus Cloacimonetes bacterium]|nr:prolyl oligopeptidase family serine peptidase [Candidatus Cloacimonadota bacterium]